MIMMAEPLAQSVRQIKASIAARTEARAESAGTPKKVRVIHVSPRGRVFDDRLARELATYTDLVFVSSRYGGADQRFLNSEVDEEISIGDYILTGGELAALVLIDAIGRLKNGVLGNDSSATNETFAGTNGLLEHPQFTRPRDWAGHEVPAVYMSGDHAKIAAYQEGLGFLLTALLRPDLLKKTAETGSLTSKKISAILKQLGAMSDLELAQVGLLRPGETSANAVEVRLKIEAELNQLQTSNVRRS